MIEVELNGKAGRVCSHARVGEIQCPLIIRPTSEDVITSTVLGSLKHIRPHLWLGPMLNVGLETTRFRQVWFKGLQLSFWKKVERYPAELLDFREGNTQPDVAIEWENPPTTLWIECKYLSPLATKTVNSTSNDQALRGIRTLLASTGHIRPPGRDLFEAPTRRALWLALLCDKPEPLVDQYRDREHLVRAIGRPEAIRSLPEPPFIGTLAWGDIAEVLKSNQKRMMRGEGSISESVQSYISFKLSQARMACRGAVVPLPVAGDLRRANACSALPAPA